jgi:hypothetical protein
VAITGGRPDYAALVDAAKTPEEVGKLWTQANQAGHLDDALAATIKAKAAALGAKPKVPGQPRPEQQDGPHPDDVQRQLNPSDYGDSAHEQTDAVVDAEIVDDLADVQAVWFQVIAAAGSYGLTTEQVEAGFAQRNGGIHPSSGTVAQMKAFLAAVQAGEVR